MVAPAEDSDEDSRPSTPEPDDDGGPIRVVAPGRKEATDDISDLRNLVKDLAKTVGQLVQKQTDSSATSQRVKDKSKVQCYKCQEYGHYSRECKARGKGGSRPGDDKSRGNEHSRDAQSMREAKALARSGSKSGN